MCNPMAGCVNVGSKPASVPEKGKEGQKTAPEKKPVDMGPNPGVPGGMPRVVSTFHMNFRTALSLFARDAGKMAEQFSDTVVATAAYDIKAAGRVIENVAVPVLIVGALAFGAAKMVETGDTSTFQRAIVAMGF